MLVFCDGDAHASDTVYVIVQSRGGLRRCGEAQALLQVLCHCATEAAAHIAAVQPYRRAQFREFTNAGGHLEGWCGQDKARPVFRSRIGNGKQSILRAAADVQGKYGAVNVELVEKFRCVHSFLFR